MNRFGPLKKKVKNKNKKKKALIILLELILKLLILAKRRNPTGDYIRIYRDRGACERI